MFNDTVDDSFVIISFSFELLSTFVELPPEIDDDSDEFEGRFVTEEDDDDDDVEDEDDDDDDVGEADNLFIFKSFKL